MAIYCENQLTAYERSLWYGWAYFTLIFNALGIFAAVYFFYADYVDQKEAAKKTFKYDFTTTRVQLNTMSMLYFFLTSIWILDPHDGISIIGAEIYSPLVQELLLRVPQVFVIGAIFILIQVWRNLVQAAQKLRKVSKEMRAKQNKARLRNANILVLVILVLGCPMPLFRGILPNVIVNYFTNLLLAGTCFFLGLLGAPYYAYKVHGIISKIKSQKSKDALQKIMFLSSSYAVLSFLAVGQYAVHLMQPSDSFWNRMQNFIFTHTLLSIACYIEGYAMLPKNAKASAFNSRRRSSGSSAASTVASSVAPTK